MIEFNEIKFSKLDKDLWVNRLYKFLKQDQVLELKHIKNKYRNLLIVYDNRRTIKVEVNAESNTNGYGYNYLILEYYQKNSGFFQLKYRNDNIISEDELFNISLKLICSNI